MHPPISWLHLLRIGPRPMATKRKRGRKAWGFGRGQHGTFIFVRDWLIRRRGRGRGPVYEECGHARGYWSAARLGMEGRCQQGPASAPNRWVDSTHGGMECGKALPKSMDGTHVEAAASCSGDIGAIRRRLLRELLGSDMVWVRAGAVRKMKVLVKLCVGL